MPRLPLLAPALLILATPALAQNDAQPYRARGTEPFWSLSIGTVSIRLEEPGRRQQGFARPRPIIGFNGELYRGRRITVDITHVECSDGMSDRIFKDTVTVTMGRRTLRGCGGPVLRETNGSLLDGAWNVESIAGTPVVRGSTVTIRFDNGRVSGNTGCNSFNGAFTFARGVLTPGSLATTRRACVERGLNQQEQRLLGALRGSLSVSRNRAGKLVVTQAGRPALVLAPVRG